jgi:hypothetical protein
MTIFLQPILNFLLDTLDEKFEQLSGEVLTEKLLQQILLTELVSSTYNVTPNALYENRKNITNNLPTHYLSGDFLPRKQMYSKWFIDSLMDALKAPSSANDHKEYFSAPPFFLKFLNVCNQSNSMFLEDVIAALNKKKLRTFFISR